MNRSLSVKTFAPMLMAALMGQKAAEPVSSPTPEKAELSKVEAPKPEAPKRRSPFTGTRVLEIWIESGMVSS